MLTDIHIHFGAPDSPAGTCFWSEEFEKSIAFIAMKIVTGSIFKKATFNEVRSHLFKVIKKSKYTKKAVILALDRVYDRNGNPDNEKTNLYTSNETVLWLKQRFFEEYGEDKILLGMSVNPNRGDWREEFDKYKDAVALCKWLPSTQNIDPADNSNREFYEKLVEMRIPLLVHIGPEHAIPAYDKKWEEFNDPGRLELPLSLGVTVIAAHCALPYFPNDPADDFKTLISMMEESESKGWKLFADLSALCVPFRNTFIPEVIDKIDPGRLLYGSDYPIPIVELSYKKSKNIFRQIWIFLKALFTKNPLDKNYYLLKKMGFSPKVFSNWKDNFG